MNLEKLKEKVDFIVIPTNMFYVKGGAGYFVDLKDYTMIPVLLYIQTKKDIIDEIRFSIADIIEYCGFKPDSHKGKNVDKMRIVLNKLRDEGIISCGIDFNKVKSNELIKAEFNQIAVQGNSFTKIPLHIIDKIMKGNYNNKFLALTLWSYIHCRRYKKDMIGEGKESATQVSYETITRDTAISDKTITKYFDVMVKDELLLIHNSGYLVKKNEKPVSASNIYVTVDGDLELAKGFMHEAISRYEHEQRQQGYKISKCSPEKKKDKKERKVHKEPKDENRQDVGLEVEPVGLEVKQELLEEIPVVEPIGEEPAIIQVIKFNKFIVTYYDDGDFIVEYKESKLEGWHIEDNTVCDDIDMMLNIALDSIEYARTEEERNKCKLEAELWEAIQIEIIKEGYVY